MSRAHKHVYSVLQHVERIYQHVPSVQQQVTKVRKQVFGVRKHAARVMCHIPWGQQYLARVHIHDATICSKKVDDFCNMFLEFSYSI